MDRRNKDIDRRSRLIADGDNGEGPVVYWMSRDQRSEDNWALLYAQQEAILHKKPLEVVFCLLANYPGANRRHYSFMLKPMAALQQRLAGLNIGFTLLCGDPVEMLPRRLREIDAHTVVTDFDPLRIKQQWKSRLAEQLAMPLVEVDAHNIVPAWTVSEKREYAAYTLRPKINRLLDDYLTDIPSLRRHPVGPDADRPMEEYDELIRWVTDGGVSEVDWITPGEDAGVIAAQSFVSQRIRHYAEQRNDPCQQAQSGLSPYFHFGHLAPQRVAWMVREASVGADDRAAFLEELVVRRELADNFCYYQPNYDQFDGFPEWAQKTLNAHRADRRAYTYSLEELENGATHEELWNCCQQDLVDSGKLHGYLRMYWAKKILEWTREPEEALAFAILLNDRYSLDGRDPNGYAGIAWSIGGVHDRAWPERKVFGKIRYMNENGCRRKFSVAEYIRSIKG